ncbi:RNA polymerase sigma-70 factor [Galbibacter sp. BG1]|uniref:RNA polymerase sigma-70 factor n=1 Tax=Galbibacter sp. BG1 TaxID=1170699 RepID=UPI0015BEB5B0|nr:RNA polymerase sigma-70 factor [Galbibacter sp. BG1]QLE01264.1 RNA polymerase sigma-70 factor [Galbibacter sp. BG1]
MSSQKLEIKEFDNLFNSYWHRLYAYAFNILKDPQLAEDCVQDVFTDLWRRGEELEISNHKAYLFQAVKYQCAKQLKKQSRFTSMFGLGEIFSHQSEVDESLLALERQKMLSEVLRQIDLLPEKCQMVFRLSKLEQKSNKEIASELGITTSTVENHINKALRLLRTSVSYFVYFLIVFFFLR